jgi:hypothetical protein
MTAAQDTLERWVLKAGNELIAQVHYWRAFHRAFGVRVHYITEQGRAVNIAQSIACDVEKERPCVFISRQRSEIYHPNICYIGFHPLHVFFVWNQRVHAYVKANYEKIKTLVVTGYPYNILRPTRENADLLRSRGAKFVIALLDNVYGPHTAYSREKMTGFYREFLRWVIEDGTVGLVIKPKKPHFFNDLVEIRCLFNAAQETGRCIKLERELGRFPSDAAAGADMAVGAGIASAVMESVISGCRGVHYDMWNRTFHEFYQWGYERLIFNDLERLVAALKRYKQDPASEPGLGDWSGHLDELDPFRDGRGGERVGAYMRWLLESLDLGKDRDEAIQYANGRYAETWGADKVIAMEKVREEAEEYRAVV